MIRIVSLVALAAATLLPATPAAAQKSWSGDNSEEQQRIADEFRFKGSACDAPACHNNPEGIYPESAGSIGSTSQSIPAAGTTGSRNSSQEQAAGPANITSKSQSVPAAGTYASPIH